MKIIGRSGKKYLVECELLEICQLHGYHSLYSDGWKVVLEKIHADHYFGTPKTPELLEGMTFDISSITSQISTIRSNQEKAKGAVATLRGLADSLEIAWPALVAATEVAKATGGK